MKENKIVDTAVMEAGAIIEKDVLFNKNLDGEE